MSRSGQWGARARWGWLVTTLTLGGVLMGSSWLNYRSAVRAAADLVRGQAQIFRDVVLATNRNRPDQPRADLDSLVTAQAGAGLQFVGWVRQDGNRVAGGGRAAAVPLDLPKEQRQPTIVRLESRIRAWFPPPGGPPPSELGSRRTDSREPDRPRPPPTTLVLEFEPLAATAIVTRALWSLSVSVIVAAVLIAAGLLFWRLSKRMERAEQRMEEQRRLSALGEMSAVLAHEIRNPLASLKGHAQLLLERTPAEAADRRKVERVVEEAKRLEALTTDLLDFARSAPMSLRSTDPVALLRSAAAEVAQIPLMIDSTGAPDRWPLDPSRFGNGVLANLLRNAVQVSPEGRPPVARVTLERDALVYTIRDFGPGLAPGTEERIFDPFFTTRTTGTGLGLPVARRIAELHGGGITAANAADGGAVFRVVLPNQTG